MTEEQNAEVRLNAYFYGFAPTENDSVDAILSAVAWAGKGWHHTESWADDSDWNPAPNQLEGRCAVAWIQNAAQKAADHITALEQRNAELEAELEIKAEFYKLVVRGS